MIAGRAGMRLLYALLYVLCIIMLCSNADPAEAYSRTLHNHVQPAFSQCHNTPDSSYTLATQPLYTYKRVYRRKSYIFGVGGAAILPLIGHSYIGGWNIPRGLLYSGVEYFCIMLGIAAGIAPGGSRRDSEALFIASGIIHGINIFDAFCSVYYVNKKAREQQFSIAFMPDIHSRGMKLVWLF